MATQDRESYMGSLKCTIAIVQADHAQRVAFVRFAPVAGCLSAPGGNGSRHSNGARCAAETVVK